MDDELLGRANQADMLINYNCIFCKENNAFVWNFLHGNEDDSNKLFWMGDEPTDGIHDIYFEDICKHCNKNVIVKLFSL
jgi:hypothetical protein